MSLNNSLSMLLTPRICESNPISHSPPSIAVPSLLPFPAPFSLIKKSTT